MGRTVCLAWLVVVVPWRATTGQRVLSEVQCASCAVVAELRASLGDFDGPGALDGWGLPRRASSGSFYVTQNDRLIVFDSAGTYLGTIGRQGAGPGEFRAIVQLVISAGDTLHVLDRRNLRRTILTADGSLVTMHRLEMPYHSAVVLSSGALIANPIIPPYLTREFPLHRIDRTGEVAASFGIADPTYRYQDAYRFMRNLARGDGRSFWASRVLEYAIEEWSERGERLRTLVRDAEWFPPAERLARNSIEEFQHVVQAIREDVAGRLWVLVSARDARWQSAIQYGGHPDGPDLAMVTNYEQYYDTIVEVIDPQTSRLLASHRLDEWMTGFADATHVYGFAESDIGVPTVSIWRLRLVER